MMMTTTGCLILMNKNWIGRGGIYICVCVWLSVVCVNISIQC